MSARTPDGLIQGRLLAFLLLKPHTLPSILYCPPICVIFWERKKRIEKQPILTLSPDLTGTPPEPTSTSLAGTTHDLEIKTAYYTATVPIWLDLIAAPSEWAGTFLSEEAKEVLEVLGGIVAVFAIPPATADSSSSNDHAKDTKDFIREVGRVVKEGLGGWEWDGVSLAVGVGEVAHLDDLDVWDEVCGDAGLEFVHVASSAAEDARNEFGGKHPPICRVVRRQKTDTNL